MAIIVVKEQVVLPLRSLLDEKDNNVVVITNSALFDLLQRAIGWGQQGGPPRLTQGHFNALRQQVYKLMAWHCDPEDEG